MGLYTINCIKCDKPFVWFSGNLDQRCLECRGAADAKAAFDKHAHELDTSNPGSEQ